MAAASSVETLSRWSFDLCAWRWEQPVERGAARITRALEQWPADLEVQLLGIDQLAEIACAADGSSLWRGGALGPCLHALATCTDVTAARKACSVVAAIGSDSEEAAAACVAQGAVEALAKWLCQDTNGHSDGVELQWRSLDGLRTLIARPGPASVAAVTRLEGRAGLHERLRTFSMRASENERAEQLREVASWLLDRTGPLGR